MTHVSFKQGNSIHTHVSPRKYKIFHTADQCYIPRGGLIRHKQEWNCFILRKVDRLGVVMLSETRLTETNLFSLICKNQDTYK